MVSVDGRNPAPVDMVNIPLFRLFTGCHTCWVVQDFIHQQYHLMKATRGQVFMIRFSDDQAVRTDFSIVDYEHDPEPTTKGFLW